LGALARFFFAPLTAPSAMIRMAMKFSPDRPYSDPDTAARKLLEITTPSRPCRMAAHVKFTQADPDLFA
jgi:hypothetical protein